MKQRTRKLISLLLTIMMVLQYMPLTAFADAGSMEDTGAVLTYRATFVNTATGTVVGTIDVARNASDKKISSNGTVPTISTTGLNLTFNGWTKTAGNTAADTGCTTALIGNQQVTGDVTYYTAFSGGTSASKFYVKLDDKWVLFYSCAQTQETYKPFTNTYYYSSITSVTPNMTFAGKTVHGTNGTEDLYYGSGSATLPDSVATWSKLSYNSGDKTYNTSIPASSGSANRIYANVIRPNEYQFWTVTFLVDGLEQSRVIKYNNTTLSSGTGEIPTAPTGTKWYTDDSKTTSTAITGTTVFHAVPDCTVTFMNAGVQYDQKTSSPTVGTLPTNPTWSNATFKGWYDENGVQFTKDTVVREDMTVTARYTVTITFKYHASGDNTNSTFNGTKTATLETDGITTLKFGDIIAANRPTTSEVFYYGNINGTTRNRSVSSYTGYYLEFWSAVSSATGTGTMYTNDVLITGNVTIYATVQTSTSARTTFTFVYPDGTPISGDAFKSKTITSQTTFWNATNKTGIKPASNPPSFQGGTFKWWSEQPNGSKIEDSDRYSVSGVQQKLIYAVYTNDYTVTYNNASNGEISKTTVSPNGTVRLPATAPTVTGKDFKGWTSSVDGNCYDPDTLSPAITQDTIFTATYIDRKTISFYDCTNKTEIDTQTGSILNANDSVVPDDPESFKNTGITAEFQGWYDSTNKEYLTAGDDIPATLFNKDRRYNAVYKFTVKLYDENGKNPSDYEFTSITGFDIQKTGNFFAWYAYDGTDINYDIELEENAKAPGAPAFIESNSYTLYFHQYSPSTGYSSDEAATKVPGRTDFTTDRDDIPTPTNLTASGYTVLLDDTIDNLGWYSAKSGANAQPFDVTAANPSSRHYYAHYEYETTFQDYDGSAVAVVTGNTLAGVTAPTKPDHSAGLTINANAAEDWIDSASGTSKTFYSASNMDHANKTYKAYYSYDLTFKDYDSTVLKAATTYNTFDGYANAANDIELPEQTPGVLAGWYYGTNSTFASDITGENANVKLPKSNVYIAGYKYTLSLTDEYIKGADINETVKDSYVHEGNTYTGIGTVPEQIRTGATFIGWYNTVTGQYLEDDLEYGNPESRGYIAVYKYTVTFLDSDETSALGSPQEVTTLDTIDIPADMMLEGSDFLGWYRQTDGKKLVAGEAGAGQVSVEDIDSDTVFVAAYECTLRFVDIDGTVIKNAEGTALEYKIKTNEGNTLAANDLSVPGSSYVQRQPDDGRQTHFAGWYDVSRKLATDLKITRSTTFVAAYGYNVTFVDNNEFVLYGPMSGNTATGFTTGEWPKTEPNSIFVTNEKGIVEEHDFVGWYNADNELIQNEFEVGFGDVILQAKFMKLDSCLVKFYAKGTQVGYMMAVLEQPIDSSKVPSVASKLEKVGDNYTERLAGWIATDENGENGVPFNLADPIPTGTKKLYLHAVIVPNTYSVTFENAVTEESTTGDVILTQAPKSLITMPEIPARAGYVAMGWVEEEPTTELTYAQYLAGTYGLLRAPGTSYATPERDVTFYALYRATSAIFVYDALHTAYGTLDNNGKTAIPGSDSHQSVDTCLEVQGYNFLGFAKADSNNITKLLYNQNFSDADLLTSDSVLKDGQKYYAVYRQKTVTVTFYDMLGDADAQTTIIYPYGSALGNPTVEGYAYGSLNVDTRMVFSGWEAGKDANGTPLANINSLVADVSVYAKWDSLDLSNNAHLVLFYDYDGQPLKLFNLNGGQGTEVNYQIVPYGGGVTEPTWFTPLADGYNFTDTTGKEYGDFIAFQGWFKNNVKYAFSDADNNPVPLTENIVLTAKYTKDYLVSFIVDGTIIETQTLNKNAFEAGATAPQLTNLPAERKDKNGNPISQTPNKVFDGWRVSDKDGNITTTSNYAFKTDDEHPGTKITGDTYIAAHFSDIYYLIFDSRGGSYVAPIKFTDNDYSNTEPVQPKSPERVGYTFLGWATDKTMATPDVISAENPNGTVAVFATPMTGHKTLYAVWKAKYVSVTVMLWQEKGEMDRKASSYPYTSNVSNYITGYALADSVIGFNGRTFENLYQGNPDENGGVKTKITLPGDDASTTMFDGKARNLTYYELRTSDPVNKPAIVVPAKVSGSGSSVVNVYYDRKAYTLKFDVGTGTNNRQTMTSGEYTVINGVYYLTAKLGDDISAKWPHAGNDNFQFGSYTSGSTINFQGWSGYNATNSQSGSVQVSKIIEMSEMACQMIKKYENHVLKGVWGVVNPYFLMYMTDPLIDESTDHLQSNVAYHINEEYTQIAKASGYFSNKDIEGMDAKGTATNTWPSNFKTDDQRKALRQTYAPEDMKNTNASPELLFYQRKTYRITLDMNDIDTLKANDSYVRAELATNGTEYDKNNVYIKGTLKTGESTKYTLSVAVKFGEKLSYYTPADPVTRVVKDGGKIIAKSLFKGWFYEPEGVNRFEFDMATMPKNAITIYACWEDEPISIGFYLDEQTKDAHYYRDDVQRGDSVDVNKPDNDPQHGQFIGWYYYDVNVPGVRLPFEPGETQITSDSVIFAAWRTEGLTISYSMNTDFSGAVPEAADYKLGELAVIKDLEDDQKVTSDKKYFIGWVREGGDGHIYQPGDRIEMYEDVVFGAVWAGASEIYTLIYHSNPKDNSAESTKTFYYVYNMTINRQGSLFTIANSAFVKWTYDVDVDSGDVEAIIPLDKFSKDEYRKLDVYAQWETGEQLVKITKVWNDNNNAENLRPTSLEIKVKSGNEDAKVATYKGNGSNSNEWRYEATVTANDSYTITEDLEKTGHDTIYVMDSLSNKTTYSDGTVGYTLANRRARASIEFKKEAFADYTTVEGKLVGVGNANPSDWKLAYDENGNETPVWVYYLITVKNTGEVPYYGVKVSDKVTCVALDNGVAEQTIGMLMPDEEVTVLFKHRLTQADVDNHGIHNTALITYAKPTDPNHTDPFAQEMTCDIETVQEPEITIAKSQPVRKGTIYEDSTYAYVDGMFYEGDIIEYVLTIENTGNITLKNIAVTDDAQDWVLRSFANSLYGDSGVTNQIWGTTGTTELAPGASFTITYEYVLTTDDVAMGEITNGASVTSKEKVFDKDTDGKVEDELDADVEEDIECDGELSVVKTVVVKNKNGETVPADTTPGKLAYLAEEGYTIEYTVVVTNTGNVTVTDIEVTDSMQDAAITEAETNPEWIGETLKPGEALTYKYTYTVTQADIDTNGLVGNVATATGNDPNGEELTTPGTDSETVHTKYDPQLSVVKELYGYIPAAGGEIKPFADQTAAQKYVAELEDTLIYKIIVTNAGNVTLDEGVTVTDNRVNAYVADYQELATNSEPPQLVVSLDGKSATIAAIPVKDSKPVYFAYDVTFDDVDTGVIKNTATATWEVTPGLEDRVDGKEEIEATSDEKLAFTKYMPHLTIEKTAAITYGENSFAKGLKDTADAGDTITYTIKVKNDGNVTVKNIMISDMLKNDIDITDYDNVEALAAKGIVIDADLLAELRAGFDLDPYEEPIKTITYTYTVSQIDVDSLDKINNVASAIGEGPAASVLDPNTDDNDDVIPVPAETSDGKSTESVVDTTVVHDPAMAILKAAEVTEFNNPNRTDKPDYDTTKAAEGDVITYTVKITNTGNTTLEKIDLDDSMYGKVVFVPANPANVNVHVTNENGFITAISIDKLERGEDVTITYKHTVTTADLLEDEISNAAEAEGYETFDLDEEGDPKDGATKVTDADENTGDSEADIDSIYEPALLVKKELVEIECNSADHEHATPNENPDLGDVINYKVTITNSGTITLNDIVVDDELSDLVQTALTKPDNTLVTRQMADSKAISEWLITTLKPGEVVTITYTYTAIQSDIDAGKIYNKASAEAPAPREGEDPIENDADVTVEITVPVDYRPGFEVTKKAYITVDDGLVLLGDKAVEEGNEITYRVTVKNTGNVTLEDVTVADPLEGISDEGTQTIDLIGVGESEYVDFTYTVTDADAWKEKITNTATATVTLLDEDEPEKGTEKDYSESSDPCGVEVDCDPGLTVTKTSEQKETIVELGDILEYEVTITNSGNVTLKGIIPADSLTLDLTTLNNAKLFDPIDLAPGKDATITYKYEVTQVDVDRGYVPNKASATAKDQREDEPDIESEETNDSKIDIFTLNQPALSIVKKADKDDGVPTFGTVINYEIVITNTGNVTLKDFDLDDAKTGDKAVWNWKKDTDGKEIKTLAPEESVTVTYSYTVTQDDLDALKVENTAKVDAKSVVDLTDVVGHEDDEVETATDTADKTVKTKYEPKMTTTKKAEITKDKANTVAARAKLAEVNDIITYTVEVKNTGNVTLRNVEIKDTMKAKVTLVGDNAKWTIDSLAPGKSFIVEYTYVVIQADINNNGIVNTATASAQGPDAEGATPPADDSKEVPTNVFYNPLLGIHKAHEHADYELKVDDTATFHVAIRNLGNVDMKGVLVFDTLIDSVTNVKAVDGSKNAVKLTKVLDSATGKNAWRIDEIKVHGSVDISYDYKITQADVDAGEVRNTAIAKWQHEEFIDKNTSHTGEAIVLPKHEPAKEVTKKVIGKATDLKVGDKVEFEVTVKNIGNVTLKDIVITDSLKGSAELAKNNSWTVDTLAPGAYHTVKYTYTVTQGDVDNGGFTNAANATAKGAGGIDPEENLPATVDASTNSYGDLPVKKDSGSKPSQPAAGDTISFKVTVKNTGTMTVHNIEVKDSLLPDFKETIVVLAPGEEKVYAYDYTITTENAVAGKVENSFTATGKTAPNKDNPQGTTVEGNDKVTTNSDLKLTITYQFNGAGGKGTKTVTYILPYGADYSYLSEQYPSHTCSLDLVAGKLTKNENITVTYVRKTFKLIIHYVDEAGNTFKPDFVKEYGYGDLYHVVSPQVPGWTADFKFHEGTLIDNQILYVHYAEDKYTLTVTYRGLDNTIVAPAKVLSDLKNGETVTVESPEVDGYKAGNAFVTVTMNGANKKVVVWYTPVKISFVNPETKETIVIEDITVLTDDEVEALIEQGAPDSIRYRYNLVSLIEEDTPLFGDHSNQGRGYHDR